MKKIVDGLLYDVDKATLIYKDDKHRQTRSYYKTNNGNYFCVYGDDKINPMTEDEIKELLGEDNIDVYLKFFDEPPEA